MAKVTVVNKTRPAIKVDKKWCYKASVAAGHYALLSAHDWWHRVGHFAPRPVSYKALCARREKTYRRVLKIFQKYLP